MNERFHRGRKMGVGLAALIGLCALTVTPTFAKFSAREVFQDDARAARFSVLTSELSVLTTEQSEEERIINGDGTTVLFTVANGNGTASEVAIAYDVAVSLPPSLAGLNGFSCELTCNGKSFEGFRSKSAEDTVVYTFLNVGAFEAGTLSTDRLTVSVYAKPEKSTETFSVSIDVLARQTKE